MFVCLDLFVCVCARQVPGRSRKKRDDGDNEYYEVSAVCWTAVGNSHGNFPRLHKQNSIPTIRA